MNQFASFDAVVEDSCEGYLHNFRFLWDIRRRHPFPLLREVWYYYLFYRLSALFFPRFCFRFLQCGQQRHRPFLPFLPRHRRQRYCPQYYVCFLFDFYCYSYLLLPLFLQELRRYRQRHRQSQRQHQRQYQRRHRYRNDPHLLYVPFLPHPLLYCYYLCH